MTALLVAVTLLLGTGAVALLAGRRPRFATAFAAAGAVAAAAIGVVPALGALRGEAPWQVRSGWDLPGGTVHLGLDPLSAFFLVPLFGLGAVCAVYGAAYMQSHRPARALGPQAFFFNTTIAAMVVVLVARSGVILLVAWEVMTLASYLLVSFEHERPEVRRAGWVYLVAGHIGVGCLLALVLTFGRITGSPDPTFEAVAAQSPAAGPALLVLALAAIGFGVKAGLVPLHVWLPEAHAAAPSHVSALMSGVLVKLGLYGLLRVTTFVRPAAWWGPALIGLGLAGALGGISLAVYQRDLKRALAYSTIENVGIIVLGLGAGFWALSHGHHRAAALGIYGALLHLWNHTAAKGLLFLCAGSILHGAGTRDLERLGGLLRRMPWTGTLTLFGAVAIAGLPPLNAFASEWLIYLGLLEGGMGNPSGSGLLPLFATAGLALTGALAVLAFVRLVGVALLGQPRSQDAERAHESGPWLIAPLILLAGACAAMSLAANSVVRLFALPAQQLAGLPVDASAASAKLWPVVTAAAVLCGALLLAGLVLAVMLRRNRAEAETWGCGYLAPSPRMQYTARSFAEIMAERILPPHWRVRVLARTPTALFAEPGNLSSDSTDPLTRSAYEPFFDHWAKRFSRLRWLQQGILHVYLFYILLIVVAALAWASARRWWWGSA